MPFDQAERTWQDGLNRISYEYIYIFQRRLREDLDKGARPALELNPSAAELEFRVCEVESFGFRIFRLCTV